MKKRRNAVTRKKLLSFEKDMRFYLDAGIPAAMREDIPQNAGRPKQETEPQWSVFLGVRPTVTIVECRFCKEEIYKDEFCNRELIARAKKNHLANCKYVSVKYGH